MKEQATVYCYASQDFVTPWPRPSPLKMLGFIASVKEPFCRKLTKYPRCAGGVKSVMVIVTLALRLFLRTSLYS
jgi:hypothetical protein